MGQNVGQLWIELGADVARLRKDMGEASSIVKGFKSEAESAFKGVQAAALSYLSFQGITQAFKATVQAAAEEEQSLLRLEAVLRAHGVTNKEVTRIYNDMADELQMVTRYSDDQIRSAQELLTTMGVQPSKMREIIEASMQLATRTGDLSTAAQALGQAFEGNYKQLKRLIPQLQDVKKGQLELDDVLRIVRESFGDIAQKEMDGYAGQVNKLTKEWKEFGESIGSAVIPPLTEVLKMLNSISARSVFEDSPDSYGANRGILTHPFFPGKSKPEKTASGDMYSAAEKYAKDVYDAFTISLASKDFIKPKIEKEVKDASMSFEQLRDLWIKAEAEKYAAAEELNEKWWAEQIKKQAEALKAQSELDISNSEYDMRLKREGMIESWELKAQQIEEINRLELESIALQREAMYSLFNDMSNLAGGDQGASKMVAGLKQFTDAYTETDQWTYRLSAAQDYYDALYAIADKSSSDIIRLEEASQNLSEIKKQASFQRTLSMAAGFFGSMAGAALSYYNSTGQQSQAAFMAYKALAVAETIISGIAATQAAYKTGLEVTNSMGGGVAFAAIAALVTAARVAQIIGTNPGTSSMSSFTGGYSAATPSVSPTVTEYESAKGQNINIYVYGNVVDHQKFARQIVSELNQAESDGVH